MGYLLIFLCLFKQKEDVPKKT